MFLLLEYNACRQDQLSCNIFIILKSLSLELFKLKTFKLYTVYRKIQVRDAAVGAMVIFVVL